MVNLTLISLEDLLNEIFNRFDGFICMGIQRDTAKNMDSYYRRWAGSSATCLGLCDLLYNIIKDDYMSNKSAK